MKQCVIFFILFFFIGYCCPQQYVSSLPRTNYEIFSGLLNKCLDPVADKITVLGSDKIYRLKLNADAQSEKFFHNVFGLRFPGLKLIKGTGFDSLAFTISVSDIVFSLKYPESKTIRLLGDKVISRSVSVKFNCAVQSPSGEILWMGTPSDKSSDTIRLDNLDYVQTGEYDFIKAPLPKESLTSKLIVPAVIMIATAITIILFFAVRSK